MTSRRRFLLGLAALGFSGCARIPTSGPVQRISVDPRAQGGVEITPAPPLPDASLESIVYGFLTAMSANGPDYSAARAYLTEQAARTWDPAAGVTVFQADGHSPIVTENGASLWAPIVGSLDAAGRYTSSYQTNQRYDLGAVQHDGQWRLDNPPAGRLISQQSFIHNYAALPVYFLDSTARVVIPELVYFPKDHAGPAEVISAVIAGPSQWLATVVTNLASGLRLVSPIDIVRGQADIRLESSGGMATERFAALAAQILWSLAAFDEITGARLIIDGESVTLGQSPDDFIDVSDVAGFRPPSLGRARELIVVGSTSLQRLPAGSADLVVASGVFSTPAWHGKIAALDADVPANWAAVLTSDQAAIVVGPIDGLGEAEVVLRGTGLLGPTILADGRVVTIDSANRVLVSGGASIPIDDLPVGEVTSFSVSPDQTRMALTIKNSQGSMVGLVQILPDTKIGHWRQIMPATSDGPLTGFRDVAWAGESSLVALAALPGLEQTSVYQFDVDGAWTTELGPSGQIGVAKLAVQPQLGSSPALVMTQEGRVLRHEEGARWVTVASDVRAIALG